jgi:hypothetical protein
VVGKKHSWALTDWSVTSGTGLTMMPECRCRTKQYKLTENYRCRTELFIGIPAFRHPCIPRPGKPRPCPHLRPAEIFLLLKSNDETCVIFLLLKSNDATCEIFLLLKSNDATCFKKKCNTLIEIRYPILTISFITIY